MVVFAGVWKRCKGKRAGSFPTEEVLTGLARDECAAAWAKV
jgi:hypothetical protein